MHIRRIETKGTLVLIAALIVALWAVGEWVLSWGPWLLSMAATFGFIDTL